LADFRLPYGQGYLTAHMPDGWPVQLIAPVKATVASHPARLVSQALDAPVGTKTLSDYAGVRSAAIAINDKTRPVPLNQLLPPLLERLEKLGLSPQTIHLLIATGAHQPVHPNEFAQVVPPAILKRYPVLCHDANDRENLVYLGKTRRSTPVWINRHFVQADLRIVVGNIEPHQFMGFSGGVKGAAIGLAGEETINHNHAMMTNHWARPGRFEDNPPRQDVEEIGRMIGVHFVLDSILNEDKQIVDVIAGEPGMVMRKGIPLVLRLYQVPVPEPFDLVIASPGGHPKDINLYQAQKALAHASLVTKDGGTVILVAACSEGVGSERYEQWMKGMTSHEAVLQRFRREGFRIGRHKAFQIARDAVRVRVLLVSQMSAERVRRLLLTPVSTLEKAVSLALKGFPAGARIGVMPWANATIPVVARSFGGET